MPAIRDPDRRAHRAGAQWDSVTYPVETTQFVPLFAYEAILTLIGAAVLLYVIRRFGPRLYEGHTALLYIMWYGAARTALEPYRVHNWIIFGIPTAMWLCFGFVLARAWLVIRHRSDGAGR